MIQLVGVMRGGHSTRGQSRSSFSPSSEPSNTKLPLDNQPLPYPLAGQTPRRRQRVQIYLRAGQITRVSFCAAISASATIYRAA